MKERNKRIAYGVLGIFVFLCIWYAATKFTSLGKVMPDPVTVIAGLCKAICCTDRYAFYDYAHPH